MGIVGQHPNEMPVEQMALSRDSKYLATISHDESIRFWDIAYFGKPVLTKEQRQEAELNTEMGEIEESDEEEIEDSDDSDEDNGDDDDNDGSEDYSHLFDDAITDDNGEKITFNRNKMKRRMNPPNQKKKELRTFFKDFK